MINFSCSYLYRFGQEKQVTVSGTASDNPNEAVREASYRAYLSPNEQQSKTLDYMLAARDQLSKLVGFNSFAGKLDCLCSRCICVVCMLTIGLLVEKFVVHPMSSHSWRAVLLLFSCGFGLR